MKKMLILFLLFLIPFTADAKEYYGPYSEFSDYEIKLIQSSELINTETKVFYPKYTETKTKEYLTHSMEGIKTGETNLVESDWLYVKPDTDEYTTVKECTKYTYTSFENKIYLNILNKSDKAIILEELTVFDTVSNEIIKNYTNFNFNPEEILMLLLEGNYDYKKVAIRFKLNKETAKNVKLIFNLNDNFDLEGNGTEALIFNDNTSNKVIQHTSVIPISKINSYNEKEEISYCDKGYGKTILEEAVYKTITTLYEYEITTREYLGYASEVSDEYILELDKPVTMYRFRSRDKVEIADILFIDNKDQKLEDFILSSTTDDIKITSNIDYSLNGTYTVNYILPFTTVKTEVIVNIKDNLLNLIKAQKKYINKLEEKTVDATHKVDIKNVEIKDAINEMKSTEEDLIDKLWICEFKLSELEKQQKDLNETTVFEKQYISPIAVALVFLILLILSLIKRKLSNEKNN